MNCSVSPGLIVGLLAEATEQEQVRVTFTKVHVAAVGLWTLKTWDACTPGFRSPKSYSKVSSAWP